MFRRTMSLVVSLALVLTLFGSVGAATEGDGAAQALTRGALAEMLLVMADDYHPELQMGDLIRGYEDGSVREEQAATRLEALVMISRAFGELPELNAHYARTAQTGFRYSDVPAWAAGEVDKLIDAGTLADDGSALLQPTASVTAEEVEAIVKRIWAYKGTNPKDDFYAAVNKDALAKMELYPGNPANHAMVELSYQNAEQISAMIDEIVAGEHEQGSREQKIADLYANILNWDARNEAGIEPLQAYLDAVEEMESLSDLWQLRRQVMTETGATMLLGFAPGVDLKNSERYTMYLSHISPSMSQELYLVEGNPQAQIYLDYLNQIMTLSGLSEEEAAAAAELIFAAEQEMAAVSYDVQDLNNVDKVYNVYSMAELQALFADTDMSELLQADGYQATEEIIVSDPGLLELVAGYFTQENLELLRAYARFDLLSDFSGALSQDFEQAAEEFNQRYLGVEGSRSAEEKAALSVQSMMADYLGEIYVEEYFSAEAKADVEAMVADFIEIYKGRIARLDWMSDETKAMALRKLDTMAVKVGYPDAWDDFMDEVEILAVEDGGSFFANACAISRAALAENIRLQNEPVDKSEWFISAYTVNAFYNATANEIVFPAGILQAPYYDVEASYEENLGGIGFVIAHEITHSFDNNGAKFDENGNAANWWTAEDYAVFEELCGEVVAYFDGIEVAPGISNNGLLTLSENIADLGAIACILEAAGMNEAPDLPALFEALASCWLSTGSREYVQLLTQLDVHSADKLRVNRVVQSSEAFYEAYEIGETDGMYLAPAERVNIW